MLPVWQEVFVKLALHYNF